MRSAPAGVAAQARPSGMPGERRELPAERPGRSSYPGRSPTPRRLSRTAPSHLPGPVKIVFQRDDYLRCHRGLPNRARGIGTVQINCHTAITAPPPAARPLLWNAPDPGTCRRPATGPAHGRQRRQLARPHQLPSRPASSPGEFARRVRPAVLPPYAPQAGGPRPVLPGSRGPFCLVAASNGIALRSRVRRFDKTSDRLNSGAPR